MNVRKKNAIKMNWLIYDHIQGTKIREVAALRSKKEDRTVSESEVLRSWIDEGYDNEVKIKASQNETTNS